MNRKSWLCTLNLASSDRPQDEPVPITCPTRIRLADEYACLERIEQARASGQDPVLAKVLEQRIVWRELLDLELQDADELIERIAEAAGRD